ncbi:MAG: hypothetical protein HN341_11520 [Verrucomicrobia bacterium]|jgi:hypothetical protein|nr:hypothetical protein [Verrucomicrobiota bacterium]
METVRRAVIIPFGLAVVLTLGYGSQALATDIISGFGTLTKDGDLSLTTADGNWHTRTTDVYGDPSAAVMTTTTLAQTNAPFINSYRPYECPVHKIIDNTAGTHSGSRIQVSFDYTVTLGSPTLGFYLSGIDVTGAAPYWSGSPTARGGNAWCTDGDDNPAHNTTTYSLFDGTVSGQNLAEAYNGGLANLTGAGTVSVVIDLSGHGVYTDLSAYEYIAATFAWDFDEAATIEVSNLTVETLPDTTIMKDFGTLTLDADISISNIDGNWHARNPDAYDPEPHKAVMTTTTLTVDNDPFSNSDREYECPVGKIIDNTAGTHSGAKLVCSFDYEVTLGSPSLYFYLRGVDVTGASPVWSINHLARAGDAWHSETDVETYCLFDGLADRTGVGGSTSGSSDWAYNTGLTDLADSGTISVTINLSTHGTYQDLSEYEYIAANFAWDFDEAGVIEVSNLTVDIVPPGGTVFVVR